MVGVLPRDKYGMATPHDGFGGCRLGMLLLLLLLRHPARAGGRNCQTRSPWAGRKGAVGRHYAGRAGADDDRGGGGSAMMRGGGACARGGGWGHLWMLPWSPPPLRGGG